MQIRTKILGFVGACSLVTLAVAGTGIASLRSFEAATGEVKSASARALNGANLNRLAAEVVMESRGIYASATPADAARFAPALLKNLTQMEALLAGWAPLVPEADQAQFERLRRDAAAFATVRRETVRLGTDVAPRAAAEYGFNEANTANRKAFQAGIEATVARDLASLAAVERDMEALYRERLMLLVGMSLAGVLACLLIGLLVGQRQIAKPLAAVSVAIRRLAEGHHDLPAAQERRDEIGAIWQSMQVFAAAMREAEALRASQDEESAEAGRRRRSDMAALADRFEGSEGGLVAHLGGTVGELEATARLMAANAEQTNRQSSAVMSAANETSMNVQAVATATEELAATANEIGQQVLQTSIAASGAVDSTRRTNARVEALARSAASIGEVVALISTIAGQTNLLALNATIEAARAGEAGRGFAVVAAEVKALAAQTARATEEITSQIAQIQEATRDTVGAIAEIGSTIGTVHQIATGVAAAVEEQQVATQEIARSISDAARGTQAVTENMAEVQHAAVQAGAGAAQMLAAAGALARESGTLSREVRGFVGTVRAA